MLDSPLDLTNYFTSYLTLNDKLPRTKSPRFYSQVYKSAENHTIRVLSKASEVCNRFFCIHPHFKKVGGSASDYKLLSSLIT